MCVKGQLQRAREFGVSLRVLVHGDDGNDMLVLVSVTVLLLVLVVV